MVAFCAGLNVLTQNPFSSQQKMTNILDDFEEGIF